MPPSRPADLPRRVLLWLSLTAAMLVAGYIVTDVFQPFRPYLPLFNLGDEGTLQSLFSALLLLTASVLLARLARAQRRWQWALLSLVFLYLSLDEWLALHEELGRLMIPARYAHGLLRYSWVVPGLLFVAALAALLLPLVLRLPARTRRLFLWSAGIFLGGAVGMEMLAGLIVSNRDWIAQTYSLSVFRWLYHLEILLEETMEMAGSILFIYALLDYHPLD